MQNACLLPPVQDCIILKEGKVITAVTWSNTLSNLNCLFKVMFYILTWSSWSATIYIKQIFVEHCLSLQIKSQYMQALFLGDIMQLRLAGVFLGGDNACMQVLKLINFPAPCQLPTTCKHGVFLTSPWCYDECGNRHIWLRPITSAQKLGVAAKPQLDYTSCWILLQRYDPSAVYHQVGRVMKQKLLNWFHRMRSNYITERSPDNHWNGTSCLPV